MLYNDYWTAQFPLKITNLCQRYHPQYSIIDISGTANKNLMVDTRNPFEPWNFRVGFGREFCASQGYCLPSLNKEPYDPAHKCEENWHTRGSIPRTVWSPLASLSESIREDGFRALSLHKAGHPCTSLSHVLFHLGSKGGNSWPQLSLAT